VVQSLSAVIIAQDEERTIGRVLSAIKDLVSEIVLVDSGSSDRTMDIAREYSARVIHQDWLGYSEQKNFALEQAGGDWILSLDADEIVTPELAEEIKMVLSKPNLESWHGFKLARLMFVGDQAVAHGGFYPDTQLRLFRRGVGRFKDRLVHESVAVRGRIGRLKNHLLHLSYRDLDHFKSAHEKYARLAAQESLRSGFNLGKGSLLNLYLHPPWTFVYRYILRGGFMDGALGLQMNLAYSDYVRKKILYYREAVKASRA
jgi:glycosyltransferase involved in cell wall biosynthesis